MRRLLGILLLALSLPLAGTAAEPPAWRVIVASDVYTDYRKFLGPRDPLALRHYGGPHSRRDVVELVLLQQALHRGGSRRPLRFLLADSENRTLKALAQGDADVSGASLWSGSLAQAPGQLALSPPLVREGDFLAGLYLPQGHAGLARIAAEPGQLRHYTAVCAESWKPDLATLHALGSPVLPTENWDSMLGMLHKQRADYLLAPFQPTADFRLEAGGLVLLPVPGLKVRLPGSRHFLLSRQGQDAAELEAALREGMALLEKDGLIRRAYRESGFDDVRVRGWRVLNP